MISQDQFLEAAKNGNRKTVRQYLDQREANLECRGYLNMTALLLASSGGYTDIVRLLVDHGANIQNAWYPDKQDGTALEMAAERGHTGIVSLLLAAGCRVNNPLTGKSPSLIGAALGGHLSILDNLLDAGANCHSVTGDKTTLLTMISG